MEDGMKEVGERGGGKCFKRLKWQNHYRSDKYLLIDAIYSCQLETLQSRNVYARDVKLELATCDL